jgi:hypothetical protein
VSESIPPLEPVDPPAEGATLDEALEAFLTRKGGLADYLSQWTRVQEIETRGDGTLYRYHGYWYDSDGPPVHDDGYVLVRRVGAPLEAALGEGRFAVVAGCRLEGA